LSSGTRPSASDQARLLGEAWERVKRSEDRRTRLLAYKSSGEIETFHLGPHAPPLTLDDLDLIHRLWLKAVARMGVEVHHRDIVRAALEQFEAEMSDGREGKALDLIRRQVKAGNTGRRGRSGDREEKA
jgi:hypothetical protein